MSDSDRGPVIVTGGSRGIGAAAVEMLAAEGRPVVFSYASNEAAARRLCERVAAAGGRAVAYKGDVAAEEAIEALFATCAGRFGPPTGVFANAGITGTACRVAELDAANLRRVLDVNVTGAFLTAKTAVRVMSAAGGGAIVLMSSRAAKLGGAGDWVHYAASKAAIDTLCVGLAAEVGAQGIRVNAVAPGLIDTEIHVNAGRGERVKTVGVTVPLGRAGRPEEVASAVRWLLSSDSAYVSGTVVGVGGGR